jgi:hypothetical protein
VLARGGSQERLKKLWIDDGDLKTLLRAPGIGGVHVRAALAGLGLLGRQILGTPGEKTKSPLKGERMSKLLVGAIGDIDESADHDADGSLLPDTGSLDLYVTATDLHGFEMVVPTGIGGTSQHDRQHAQVLHFAAPSRADADAQFGTRATGALAFAARATARHRDPALRRALVMSGLLQDNVNQAVSGLPGIRNLPILGALFGSRDFQRNETELVIIVTPYLVTPTSPAALGRPDAGFGVPGDVGATLFGQLNLRYGVDGQAGQGTYHGNPGFIIP